VKAYHGIEPVFDDPNLVSDAGLVALIALADAAGLDNLISEHCTLPVPALVSKVRTVVAGMAAGADSIDDLDRLRAGANDLVIGGVRAPSTIGTFLRSVTNGGHIEQVAKVNRLLLANLARLIPGLVGGGEPVFVDIDDTIREVHGHQKGGAGFGYTGVRGLNAMVTTITAPEAAPVIAEFSLRKGNTSSGKGAARQIARALTTTKNVLSDESQLWVRGDSAFCTSANVSAVIKAGAWFSFTAKAWPTVTRAIASIPEDAWKSIQYPNAIWDEETEEWISEAEVAEVPFTAFSSKPANEQVDCRLIVRRVERKHSQENEGQGTLFTDYRHHAFITNCPLGAVEVDKYHRAHAVVEQVIAELKGGPLTHLPSGKFHANAMWLALAVITLNLMRGLAHASLMPKARFQTVRQNIISIPARIAHRARKLIMHMPTYWPWADCWEYLWRTATRPKPLPA